MAWRHSFGQNQRAGRRLAARPGSLSLSSARSVTCFGLSHQCPSKGPSALPSVSSSGSMSLTLSVCVCVRASVSSTSCHSCQAKRTKTVRGLGLPCSSVKGTGASGGHARASRVMSISLNSNTARCIYMSSQRWRTSPQHAAASLKDMHTTRQSAMGPGNSPVTTRALAPC